MRFKYTGDLPVKDVDLVLGGVFKSADVIVKGTEFEIPDDNALLIQRTQLNGNYEEIAVASTKNTGKKFRKTKENKEEEK